GRSGHPSDRRSRVPGLGPPFAGSLARQSLKTVSTHQSGLRLAPRYSLRRKGGCCTPSTTITRRVTAAYFDHPLTSTCSRSTCAPRSCVILARNTTQLAITRECCGSIVTV